MTALGWAGGARGPAPTPVARSLPGSNSSIGRSGSSTNERARRIRTTESDPAIEQMRQLLALKGIGPNSAWLFVREFFAWRQIENRRQLGALAGLTPTPYQSGNSEREQGIRKAGNRRLRAMAIEMAWCWVRYQPHSALSQWYRQRFAHGNSRLRRLGIVALARKLLVQLWHYLKTGAVPEGAETLSWRVKMTGRREQQRSRVGE